MTPRQIDRYARHLMLREVGGPGQNAMLRARVAIVGAGGLGGPAGLYLAAAGIGHVTVIDDDQVERSNLQRQVQFSEASIGEPKARVLADRMMAINPDCIAGARQRRLDETNAHILLDGYDVVLDGTDSFETRFAINAACLHRGIPLVSGAVGRWDGQLGVFAKPGPCYRCFVTDAPEDAQSCAEVGIIGALTGIVGSAMALEAIKIVTGAGHALAGRLWLYDGLAGESRTVRLSRDPNCPACGG